VALEILQRIEVTSSYADKLLETALKKESFSLRDRALIVELVNGVTRWRGRLDWILNRLVEGGINKLTPWIRNILRLGLYQILFLNQIPTFAATDESVKLAKKYGHEGTARLVNAVLRRAIREASQIKYPLISEDPVTHIASFYSHPAWIVRRWVERFGIEETILLCQTNNLRPPLSVRVNLLKTSPLQLKERLEKEGVKAKPGRYTSQSLILEGAPPLEESPSFQEGLFQVQDESSVLVGLLLDPQKGEKVIDLCSAPGGKATHLAELMGDEGSIIAVEPKLSRLILLKKNCERLGIKKVYPCLGNGRYFQTRPVDRVLVDVPCSGTGVLARRADLRWRLREGSFITLKKLQRELLFQAAILVKNGGVVVYSTCSIEPEENEEVIMEFLDTHPSFTVEKVDLLPSEIVDARGFLRTFPHLHGIDGVFAARLRKI